MKTILLIEDNRIMRENTAEILELSNYKVLAAENGQTGLRFAVTSNPDLIICDMEMKDMKSSEMRQELNRNVRTKGIPVIYITASAEKGEVSSGRRAGEPRYLTKPFQGTDLLSMVEKYINS